MTSDGRKGLELNWNVLNLGDSAAMHGSSLKYAWLSDGTKVAAKADDGSGNGVQKRYLGSFVYTSDTGSSTDAPTGPESLAWDEGRIFFDSSMAVADDPVLDRGESGTKRKRVLRSGGNREAVDSIGVVDSLAWVTYYRDCWFAGDHLGNVRSVIDITPGLVAPRVLEQSNYLPYGTRIQNPDLISMSDNRWRYAAKEAQHFGSLDLSLLDFGARMYDPFSTRWTTTDPMAAKYGRLSPISYCGGNPIIIYDDGGLDLVIAGKNNSSVIFKTDLINKEFSVANLGIDWKGNYTLEGDAVLSAGLDLVGIVDPTGTADLANAALQFKIGDYRGACLSAIGLIPYAGDVPKVVGKFGKDVNIISSAIDAVKVGGDVAPVTFRAFTRENFRENLGRLTGSNPLGKDAHHLLPKAFWKELKSRGINVHDPKYGRWVNHTNHNKKWKKYNDDFKKFLNNHQNATEEDLVSFAESLMQKYELY